ncbi:MAG TPA: gliding motility-associated C-terminal domain-containing protein [Puia sp.]|nr:gliding motility-associated C-terminal domain-containing protein [Puia sp.]
MLKLIPFLCLLIGSRAMAQCSYPVTLITNKDYCVGSSLIATSMHAMQKITWYRNGQAIATVIGTQSLSTTPASIPVIQDLDSLMSGLGDVRLGTDDSGNIYVLFDVNRVLKINVNGTSSQIVRFPGSITDWGAKGMYVDPAGNVYITSSNDKFSNYSTALTWKIPAGTVSAQYTDIPLIMSVSTVPALSVPITAIFVDCQNNIWLSAISGSTIYSYTPGTTTAKLVASAAGSWAACDAFTLGNEIQMDPAGNLFFLSGSNIMELVAGTTYPGIAIPGSCVRDGNRLVTDFWSDANDTFYISCYNYNKNIAFVEKWAPGATTGQQLFSFALPIGVPGNIPITMDCRGDIFLGYNNVFYPPTVSTNHTPIPNLYEYKRTTVIDSAFTPTDTGTYYAVVTDIRGYTTTSDTIHINDPDARPPSIKITATAASTPVCTPITFTAQTTNAGPDPAFQWQVSGIPAGSDNTSYSYNLFANGDQVYCIMSTQAGCIGPQKDTSNIIDLAIDPHGAASVTIATPKDPICQGDTAVFEATVTNGAATPTYQWLLNGANTGDDTSGFLGNNLKTGDVITCMITSDDVCGLAKSNSITMTVGVRPVIEKGQVFTILRGHSLTLTPVITGDVSGYLWSPATGLSDSTIADPVADPIVNTLYSLTVDAPGGCSDSGPILVNVYTPLSIPGAFTPNGDGHNDNFYVLGGPMNSLIKDFAVYDRYGAEVFHVHDAAPGDPSSGWNGNFHGSPAPLGTYVYSILMQFADGSHQAYKGTVILIR